MCIELEEKDRNEIVDALKNRIDVNFYIYADLEMGIIGKDFKVWKLQTSTPSYVLLIRKNLVISYDTPLDCVGHIREIVDKIGLDRLKYINGSPNLLSRLNLDSCGYKLRSTTLLELNLSEYEFQPKLDENYEFHTLETEDDFARLFRFYQSNPENAHEYPESEYNYFIEKKISSLKHGCTSLVLKEGNEIVSAAAISNKSKYRAMIVSVATRADRRRRGFAQSTVSFLCNLAKQQGLLKLVLQFDNPNAGRLYKRIGFAETSSYGYLTYVGSKS